MESVSRAAVSSKAIRRRIIKFGLFGSAAARHGSPEFDSSEGFRDFINFSVEAEALGFHRTLVVEHHFTGFGQDHAQSVDQAWRRTEPASETATAAECSRSVATTA